MASASTRGLRSRPSRYSSPATTVERDAEANLTEASGGNVSSKTSLEKWHEPPLRPPAPSFEDTKGLERVGVLEHMAPLGQPPSQKLLQKLKLGSSRLSLRITPGQNEDMATPTTVVEQIGLASPIDIEIRPSSLQSDQAPILSSPDRRTFSRQADGEVSPSVNITPSPRKASFSQSNSASPGIALMSRQIPVDRVQRQVDEAIRESKQIGARHLVPGLRQFHQEALSDPVLWAALEAVLNSTTSHAQFRIFKRYIKAGIKSHNNEPYTEPSPHFQSPSSRMRLGSPQTPRGSSFVPNTPSPAATPTDHASHLTSPFRLKPTSKTFQHSLSPGKGSQSSLMRSETGDIANENREANGISSSTQPSPRRRRSRSNSSSSSLSSAKSIPESFGPATAGNAEAQVNGGRPVRSTGQRQAANRVAAGNRTRSSAPVPSASKHPFSNFPNAAQFVGKKPKKNKVDIELDQAEVERRRRELVQQSFSSYNTVSRPESDERTSITSQQNTPSSSLSVGVPPPVVHPHPLVPSQAALPSPNSVQAMPDLPHTNGTTRKRPHDEIDQDSSDAPSPLSSSSASLLVPPPPVAPGPSRAATPRAAKLPLAGKARKSARVMVSPNKPKNGGITAGFSRAGPSKDSLIENGADSSPEDNDEYCASCGGEGKLLCCDGCTNSFHHTCLEPPLNPDQEVDGEWFCPRCIARRNKNPIDTVGLFSRIIRRIDDIIPKAFTLPYEVREYFEGVKTGEEGEYEEISLPRTQNNGLKMNRAGFFEEPDYKAVRDGKNNFIICYRCGKTSDGRDIIPCDYCPNRWHLDCLDPPLAVPPRRRGDNKPNASWRCPLHAEHDLASIGRAEASVPGDLGRLPRLRRPKMAVPLDVAMPRGFRNNGVIDVDVMKDEVPEIREVEMMGQVYRLPEKGVQLDFIDRVKRSWYEDQTFPALIGRRKHVREQIYRPEAPPCRSGSHTRILEDQPMGTAISKGLSPAEEAAIRASAEANARLRWKTFREQQTILDLVKMSGRDELSADRVTNLTNQLILDAPTEVTNLVQKDEREQLERLLELVQGRLGALTGHSGVRAKETGLVNGVRKSEEAQDDGSGSEMDITD